jgi:hypothetical protein
MYVTHTTATETSIPRSNVLGKSAEVTPGLHPWKYSFLHQTAAAVMVCAVAEPFQRSFPPESVHEVDT